MSDRSLVSADCWVIKPYPSKTSPDHHSETHSQEVPKDTVKSRVVEQHEEKTVDTGSILWIVAIALLLLGKVPRVRVTMGRSSAD